MFQSAGSGHIKSKSRNGFDVFINFTDPHRVMCGQPNSSIQYFMASRGDLNHGFPHNQTYATKTPTLFQYHNYSRLTNFIQWQQYYICFSDGLIWTINAFTKAWNVVTVRNSDDFVSFFRPPQEIYHNFCRSGNPIPATTSSIQKMTE